MKPAFLGLLGCLMGASVLSIAASTDASAKVNVSCADLNHLWEHKYREDFGVMWDTDGGFTCPSVDFSIAEAIYELDVTVFTGTASEPAPDFYEWVTSRIGATWRREELRGNPHAMMSTWRGNVTIYDVVAKHYVESRASALIHEARHTERSDPDHAKCWRGKLKGRAACDAYFEGGKFPNAGSGYNYDFAFNRWIVIGSSHTDLNKAMAKANLKDLILNRFNEVSNEDVKKYAN